MRRQSKIAIVLIVIGVGWAMSLVTPPKVHAPPSKDQITRQRILRLGKEAELFEQTVKRYPTNVGELAMFNPRLPATNLVDGWGNVIDVGVSPGGECRIVSTFDFHDTNTPTLRTNRGSMIFIIPR